MSDKIKVYIQELADRYIVVFSDSGNPVDPEDNAGFSYYHSAKEWAEQNDYEVQE